jgi:hypothetical protein
MQSILSSLGFHPIKKKIIWIDVEILVAAAYIETFECMIDRSVMNVDRKETKLMYM